MALLGIIVAVIVFGGFLYQARKARKFSAPPAVIVDIVDKPDDQDSMTEKDEQKVQKEQKVEKDTRDRKGPQTEEQDAKEPAASKLMPPPPRPTASNSTPSNPAPRVPTQTSVRIPSNGPLPNRLPPAKSSLSGQSSLSPASTSTMAPANRARKKVILSPGHSPLDWAEKTSSEDLSGVPYPQRITPSQLRAQTGRKGKPAWASYKGKVYNIGPYLPFHPGGSPELMKAAGRDGQALFEEIHPWVNWDNMLGSCLVGFLVPESNGEDLEGLD